MKQGIKENWKRYKALIKDAVTDLKTKGRRHRQIPNILTSTRLIAAPLFIIPAALTANIPLIVIFTAIFSLTDALDGFIARHYHLTSELGKDLDAICDKVFAGSLLIASSFFNPTLIYNLILEAIIAGINVRAKINNQTRSSVSSLYIGKIKTCALYPLLGVGFLSKFLDVSTLFNTLFIMTTSMQMLTITGYLLKYEEGHHQKEDSSLEQHFKASLEEDDRDKDKDKEKVKEKELSSSLDKTKDFESSGDLDTYRELRDILLHEVEINTDDNEPTTDKVKKIK